MLLETRAFLSAERQIPERGERRRVLDAPVPDDYLRAEFSGPQHGSIDGSQGQPQRDEVRELHRMGRARRLSVTNAGGQDARGASDSSLSRLESAAEKSFDARIQYRRSPAQRRNACTETARQLREVSLGGGWRAH
jgi:hypothetical protein